MPEPKNEADELVCDLCAANLRTRKLDPKNSDCNGLLRVCEPCVDRVFLSEVEAEEKPAPEEEQIETLRNQGYEVWADLEAGTDLAVSSDRLEEELSD